ncbi:hypothetical protein DSM106972_044370 [Dulcicalothrix desertica PCC 7102]|uniref:Uncharacterized protein n=1 Tax=Dulcicalothrix desertica PCC 7102 TaxID=232991 RepID=A0A433VDW8_9CYAN|nr:hypothetical protein DSM106972_044370 [Dulcicalothrix desertica PCC 7102]TWH44217.1 NNP family nitrate/nitrite transporter-like MFS transporter [Dulcicalothrix desertica PCC 7102]TWH51485.1 NNP family nitrate/nitrite transporter-like MFS transporter [Dulcicalothrix desertica PCC 7102]
MIRGLLSFSGRYRILHLTWFAFFLSFVIWFNIAPLATTIQQDLRLTTEQLKVLSICNESKKFCDLNFYPQCCSSNNTEQ